MSNFSNGTYLAGIDLSDYNTTDTTSLTNTIISLNVAFMILVAIVVVLRMFIRVCVVHAAGLDDCKQVSDRLGYS